MFRVVMFDDRNTEHYIEAIKCTSVEEGIQKGRQYIDDFKDCDDGTTPRHLDYRVEVVFYRTNSTRKQTNGKETDRPLTVRSFMGMIPIWTRRSSSSGQARRASPPPLSC